VSLLLALTGSGLTAVQLHGLIATRHRIDGARTNTNRKDGHCPPPFVGATKKGGIAPALWLACAGRSVPVDVDVDVRGAGGGAAGADLAGDEEVGIRRDLEEAVRISRGRRRVGAVIAFQRDMVGEVAKLRALEPVRPCAVSQSERARKSPVP
jgi:hypothetical protein